MKKNVMKKNAVLIAGILVAGAGCAHQQSGYGGAGMSQSGSDYASSSMDRDYLADSSTRGAHDPSDKYSTSSHEPVSGDPINPAVEADSSLRGGSLQARDQLWTERSEVTGLEPVHGRSIKEIKADSSMRGGSPEARGFDRQNPAAWSTDVSSSYHSSSTKNLDYSVDSDDMIMTDDTDSDMSFRASADASSNSRGGLSTQVAAGGPGSTQTGSYNGKDSAENAGLNSSPQLEDNIVVGADLNREANGQVAANHSGDRTTSKSVPDPTLAHRTDIPAGKSITPDPDPNNAAQADSSTTSTGLLHGFAEAAAAGNTARDGWQSGTDEKGRPENQVGITSNDPEFLYKNNPAQGVGSAARLETGSASSASSNSSISAYASNEGPVDDSSLAQSVKGTLAMESTGTYGLSQAEAARNITVTANNGVVTLKGTVSSQQDKDIIGIRAREVHGVNKVENQLTVSSQENPAIPNRSTGHELESATDQLDR